MWTKGWFSHVERMENDKIAKMVYVKECADSRSVGKRRKRWIDCGNITTLEH